jgi:hypothetical protein
MDSKFIKPKMETKPSSESKKSIPIVTTINNEQLPRNECRYFNRQWYRKGNVTIPNSGDVYQVKNIETGVSKWYRNDTGYLVYDWRQNMYVLKTDLKVIVEDGIVGFDENNKPILGTFSQDFDNPSTTQVYFDNQMYICLNRELVENCRNFKEALSDGVFYERQSLAALLFIEPVTCSAEYKNSLSYDSKGKTNQWTSKFRKLYKPTIFRQVKRYSEVLGNLSFGLEFETTKGKIPDPICNNLGLIPLRDGSIAGLEYVTIPHKGEIGMQAVIDSVLQLKKRTRFNNDCSLHIHIGNVPRTEEFFIGLYKVLFKLQEEIYDMFPHHKLKNLGVKKKHYTKPLPTSLLFNMDKNITSSSIAENFDVIYRFLSMGSSFKSVGNSINNVSSHPSDPHGSSKWNIRTRYYWVNFIPLLFGNKQTIEFRIHTPTFDTNKVINYLIICSAIINYTINNLNSIIKNSGCISNLTLSDVISNIIKDQIIRSEIIYYMDSRKSFIARQTSKGDIVADENKFNYSPKHIDWGKNQTEQDEKYLDEIFGNKAKRRSKLISNEQADPTMWNALHALTMDQLNNLNDTLVPPLPPPLPWD